MMALAYNKVPLDVLLIFTNHTHINPARGVGGHRHTTPPVPCRHSLGTPSGQHAIKLTTGARGGAICLGVGALDQWRELLMAATQQSATQMAISEISSGGGVSQRQVTQSAVI